MELPKIMIEEAFIRHCLTADLVQIGQILNAFISARSDEEWEQRTEAGGWTLRQLLAHLDAVAAGYLTLTKAALDDSVAEIPGFQSRPDLPARNERMINAATQPAASPVDRAGVCLGQSIIRIPFT
jgi:hypothetical protein